MTATATPRFLAACRGQPTDRPPLWMMRQAGRYLPEYREVRARARDFLDLCHTPDLACEVTLQPIRRFGFDAAIIFSDIMVPAQAMGLEVTFEPGPEIARPVRDAAAVAALREPEPEEATPALFEAIRLVARELGHETPLIGFGAAPFTLTAYMVEGGSSRDFALCKQLLLADPALGARLLERVASYTAKHLVAQHRAGARALQLFDTWAELLAPPDYERFALGPANEVLRRVRQAVGPDVPLIYFSKGGAGHLELLERVEADVVGVDWRLDIARARAALGARPVQGNLDPIVLLAGPEVTRARARAILDGAGGRGHIMNLGHGILPPTPIESVEALCETVREWKPPA